MTPELEPPIPNFHTTLTRGLGVLTDSLHQGWRTFMNQRSIFSEEVLSEGRAITKDVCSLPRLRAAVAQWSRYRMSSSPVPLKTRRVRERFMLHLSGAQTSSRWCDSQEEGNSGVVFVTCPYFKILRFVAKSLRVAS
ncbi:hypothetical protein TNCV_2230741 [Trichonephila clavipes]|uniref:Uncharacterized protein n=1 Tax=Trichonephila clavipes TaxID=2585209 RepID=A0A8X6WE16_TRICX|nr:hypothetical protein TNCV_2230741 [Trichonephila clavipes]